MAKYWEELSKNEQKEIIEDFRLRRIIGEWDYTLKRIIKFINKGK